MAYQPESGYETAIAVNNTRRGPLRFEEGIATDTDVPADFGQGAYGDTQGDGRGRPFWGVKSPEETMSERAHVGAASWIEAPTCLQDFVYGASGGQGPPQYDLEYGSEARLYRPNIAQVAD
jgi:hypothetical protein